ncbi:hypothetical protein [Nocardia jejuensis]|uniref:hypothetical protein n=1 Tax=Nocardia jejuensis TaxID=328049 RepID=UPI000833C2D6|nr:hypothetical protein [Nocardia jejuensis]
MGNYTPPQHGARGPEYGTPLHISILSWIARAIALVTFVPPRLLWEGCKLTVRIVVATVFFVRDRVLVPALELIWYWVVRPAWAFVENYLWGLLLQQFLWGWILTPLGAFLLDFFLRPMKRAVEEWLWRRVLRPALSWMFTVALPAVVNALWRWILKPAGQATVWIATFLYAWLIVRPARLLWRGALWCWDGVLWAWQGVLWAWQGVRWLGRRMLWVWQHVVRPCGARLYTGLLRPAGRWIERWILRPIIDAVAWTADFVRTWLIVWPARQFWRWILRPLLYALVALVVLGWRFATTVVRVLVVTPCRYLYHTVLQPLFVMIAAVWDATVTRPVRWVYRKVITPMNKAAADIMTAVFGN